MIKKILQLLNNYRVTPFVLLLLTIISYGLLTPFIGYFMDDWYLIWFKHVFGAIQYPAYFALDRPFMGYFYVAASFLLRGSESPLVWQIFALILRWLSTYALWGMLNVLWPNNKRQNTWVVLLAAVFPGFTQHWIAVVYSFFYACLAGFFLSITLMIKAIQNRSRFWIYYLCSVLLAAYSVAASEFYYGLELVRLAILWIVISRTNVGFWTRVKQTIKYWAIYFVIFVAFTIWRAFFFVSANHEVSILSQLVTQPKTMVIDLLRKVYQAVVDSLMNAWVNPFNIANYPAKGTVPWVVLVLVTTIFFGLFFWLRAITRADETSWEETRSWSKEAFWIGLIGSIVAVLPFWAADLQIDYLYPFDRFMLAYLLGSCLLIVAILELFGSQAKKTFIIIAVLVSVGAGYQLTESYHYKNLWSQQETLYWQLNWRMPGLKPGTALLTWDVPNGDYYSGYALSAQLNWTYADEIPNRVAPYEFILMSRGQNKDISSLAPNIKIESDFRTYSFIGNTSNSVYIAYDGNGCLRVLDSKLTPPLGVLDDYNKEVLDASSLSNLSLITQEGTTPNHPPLVVFGAEPVHTWCYYFEKAEFARQYNEYDKTLSLLNEAQEKGYAPANLSEWYPFVEAYLHLGKMEEAKGITQEIISKGSKIFETGICNVWTNYSAEITDPVEHQNLETMIRSLGCQ